MLLMSLATLLALDLQVLKCCPKPLPLVITASSAKVGSSQGNTWGVTGSAQSTQAAASEQRARTEGMFRPLCDFDSSSLFNSCPKNSVWLFAEFETALSESVKALAQAAEQKEADRVAMSEAISAFCQAFGLDDVPSGSSP